MNAEERAREWWDLHLWSVIGSWKELGAEEMYQVIQFGLVQVLTEAIEEGRRLERERRFPIQGGPSIPWSMIVSHEAQALKNHDQTLERLAERSGLAPMEALAVLDDEHLRIRLGNRFSNVTDANIKEWRDELERRRAEYEDAPGTRAEQREADAKVRTPFPVKNESQLDPTTYEIAQNDMGEAITNIGGNDCDQRQDHHGDQ